MEKVYSIYHIIGCKVGMTSRSVKQRVRNQKKYEGCEWEILETHTCADTCHLRERELQAQYGYKVDRSSYSHNCKASIKGSTPEAREKKVASTDYLNPETISRRLANTDYDTISIKNGIPTNQFLKDGITLVNTWHSATKAAKVLEFNQSCIARCCKGDLKTYKGFVWKYV